MKQEWVPIPGYEDCYAVSNDGQVARTSTYGSKPRKKWKALKPTPKKRGYMAVVLCREGRTKTMLVHRLVWAAFERPIPAGLEINHKNGVTNDNRLENLEVVTKSQNARHSFDVLKRKPSYKTHYGSASGNAKLKEGDIPEIHRLRATGLKYREIAKRYGVTPECIGYVVRGKWWRHIAATNASCCNQSPA